MAVPGVTQEEIHSFEMPKVKHGATVAWYPSGVRNQQPETATVIRIAGRNVHLITATRGVREAVRHIDDPKLKLSADQREMGAWDYTEEKKANRREMDAMAEKISLLEKQITALLVNPPKKRAAAKPRKGLEKYHSLRKEAIEAGIPVKGNPSRKWLEEQLQDVRGTLSTEGSGSVRSPEDEGGES